MNLHKKEFTFSLLITSNFVRVFKSSLLILYCFLFSLGLVAKCLNVVFDIILLIIFRYFRPILESNVRHFAFFTYFCIGNTSFMYSYGGPFFSIGKFSWMWVFHALYVLSICMSMIIMQTRVFLFKSTWWYYFFLDIDFDH